MQQGQRTSTLAALKHGDFRLLWIGLLTSSTGGSMQGFALGWLVVLLAEREGIPNLGPFYLGLVGLSRAVPGLTIGLFAGVYADRMDRRRLLGITRFGGGVIAFALAVLTLTGVVSIWWIMAFSALNAVDGAFDNVTRQAMVPALVPVRDLMSAVGLNNATLNASMLLGPLIGGFLIGPLGIGGIMLVSASSYLAAVLALLLMHPLAPFARAQRNVFRSLQEGFVYVMHEPVIRILVLISAAAALFGRPMTSMLPAVAHDTLHVGAVELSWLLTMVGAGTLLGSIVTASLGNVRDQGPLLIGCIVIWGAAVLAFGLQTALLPALALVGIPGMMQFFFNGVAYAQMQVRPADSMRGRAFAVYNTTTGAGGLPSLGQLALGSAGAAIGVNPAIALSGALLLVVLVLLARSPALRSLTLEPAEATPGT